MQSTKSVTLTTSIRGTTMNTHDEALLTVNDGNLCLLTLKFHRIYVQP